MRWCRPVIPVAREAEAGRSQVQSQAQQKQGTKQLSETRSLSKIQDRAGDVAQWLNVPEFNPQYQKKKKNHFPRSHPCF